MFKYFDFSSQFSSSDFKVYGSINVGGRRVFRYFKWFQEAVFNGSMTK